jgi:hypothetical protein
LGYPVPGGNKYRNLALLVGGVSKIETINYAAVGLGSEKGCTGDARQKLKSTDPTSHQRGHPHIKKPKTVKNNQRENGKKCCGSQMGARRQDGLADRLSVVISLPL